MLELYMLDYFFETYFLFLMCCMGNKEYKAKSPTCLGSSYPFYSSCWTRNECLPVHRAGRQRRSTLSRAAYAPLHLLCVAATGADPHLCWSCATTRRRYTDIHENRCILHFYLLTLLRVYFLQLFYVSFKN